MVVDQDRPSVGIGDVMAGEVNLLNASRRQGLDGASSVGPVIDGVDMQVVHVEQYAAAGAPCQFADKDPFGHLVDVEPQIGRGILDQDPALQTALDPVHVADRPGERSGGVGSGSRSFR